jgi:hypothetical protein
LLNCFQKALTQNIAIIRLGELKLLPAAINVYEKGRHGPFFRAALFVPVLSPDFQDMDRCSVRRSSSTP